MINYKLNPFTGLLDVVDLFTGGTVTSPVIGKNEITVSLTIPAGYTMVHANTSLAVGVVLTILGDLIIL